MTDGPDFSDELDRARQVLTLAYDRARAAGYQPDSPQMLDLILAEHSYEHAKNKRDPGGTPAGQASAASFGTGRSATAASDDNCAVEVSRVIDLRAGMPDVGQPGRGPADPSP